MIPFIVLSFIAIESSVGMLFESAGPGFYFTLMHIDLALVWLLSGMDRSISRDAVIYLALSAAVLDASMMILSALVGFGAHSLYPLYNVAYDLFGIIAKVLTVLEILALFSSNLMELARIGLDMANHWIDNLRRLGHPSRLYHGKAGARR
jgi:hypothetical protein